MRVLSLLPAATEIVATLGAVNSLVGISHACDYPASVASLPRVTRSVVDARAAAGAIDDVVRRLVGEGRSLYELDEAHIRELQPDLILTQTLCDVCAVPESDVRALASQLQPSPRVLALSATTLEGVLDDIAAVADAIGTADEAEELVAGLRARLQTVHATLKKHRAPRPAVAMIEWSDPVFASGHWVPDMVRRAGGTDVLAVTGAHSKLVTREQIASAQATVIIFAPCGYDLVRAEQEARDMMLDPGWSCLEGAAFWALDANALTSRPGPRLVDGVEVMARIFNPQLFSSLTTSRAVRLR